MSYNLQLGCVLQLIAFFLLTDTALNSFAEERIDRDARSVFRDRVEAGDPNVFKEIGVLSAEDQILILQGYLSVSNPHRPFAVELLKNCKGFGNFMQNRISNSIDDGVLDLKSFGTLSVIANDEAARSVAPFLFDSTVFGGDDVAEAEVSYIAAKSLGLMKLPNSPSLGNPDIYGVSEISTWQRWAVEHGYVPESWASKVWSIPPSQHHDLKRTQPVTATAVNGEHAGITTPITNNTTASGETTNQTTQSTVTTAKGRTQPLLFFALAISSIVAVLKLVFKKKASGG